MAHKVGKKVDFRRNSLTFHNGIEIVAVVEKGHASQVQQYVIESSFGWNPDPIRIKNYKLDKKKKYLFVQETELSEPGKNRIATNKPKANGKRKRK